MTAFHPFDTAENALENINAITEHEMTDDLRTFLEANLAKGKKASKFPLGVVSIAPLDLLLFARQQSKKDSARSSRLNM